MNRTGDIVSYTVSNPLDLSDSETEALSLAVYEDYTEQLSALYNANSSILFESLPRGARTAIFSVYYQYREPTEFPDFWHYVTNSEWAKAITELRHWNGDGTTTARRLKDANVMAAALRNCTGSYFDLVFVLDGSGSVGSYHFHEALEFIVDVVSFFEIGQEKTQVALITYASSPSLRLYLDSTHDRD